MESVLGEKTNVVCIFISQPMRGKSNAEIEAERALLQERAKKLYGDHVVFIDSFFKDADWGPVRCLGESICLLACADAAIFASGWAEARGCKIEHEVCEKYGIPIVEMG